MSKSPTVSLGLARAGSRGGQARQLVRGSAEIIDGCFYEDLRIVA